MKEQEPILNKIKKCLALSKSTNSNEAAIALKQAHALMAKHNIEVADVKLSTVESSHIKGGASATAMDYEMVLAVMVSKMFNCKTVSYVSRKIKYSNTNDAYYQSSNVIWEFIGIKPNNKIAAYTFQTLFRQLQKARSEYIKDHLYRCKKATKTKRANTFCAAWVVEINQKVKLFAGIKTKEEEQELELVKSWINKNYGEIKEGKGRESKIHDADDAIAGIVAAKDAVLNHGVHGEENQQNLLEN